MSGMGATGSRLARARRRLGLLLAVLVVALPIPVGLVLAWQVHWSLVVPAYLLGIPAWLCLVSGAWSLVRRVLRREEAARPVLPALTTHPEPAVAVAADAELPEISSELRLPAPRGESCVESRVEGSVRTPTP